MTSWTWTARDYHQPMARENVELARRGYEALARGDLEAVLELIHPDARLEDAPGLPDAGTWHGHDGVLDGIAAEGEHQEGWRLEPVRFLPAGEEVVVLIMQRARGRHTGIDMTRPISHVWRFEEGRAVALRSFSSWEEALAAVGLHDGPGAVSG
jgi:uncharacterized protein